MKIKIIITLAICVLNFSLIAQIFDPQPSLATAVQTVLVTPGNGTTAFSGRVDISDPNKWKFGWPGVSFRTAFEGTEIGVEIKDYANQGMGTKNFKVIIDGVLQATDLNTNPTQTSYTLASGLSAGWHTIEIISRNEWGYTNLEFRGFRVASGAGTQLPANKYEMKIEFIGDSQTTGYGNMLSGSSNQYTGFKFSEQDNYIAWGAIASRSLNADYHCIAFEGKGMHQNLNRGTNNTLPKMYDHTIPQNTGIIWNHSNYVPDIIVINLGTNDFFSEMNGNTLDDAAFTATFRDFISNKLRSLYPNAHIICVTGIMMSTWPDATAPTTIQRAQAAVRDNVVDVLKAAGDNKVYYLDIQTQWTYPGAKFGSYNHPDSAGHQRMANALVAFINNNINLANVSATGVNIIPTAVSIAPTATSQLSANVNPIDATDKSVTWSSVNNSIASVDPATGLVTAVAEGTVNIIVTTTDGSYKDTCVVTVKSATTSSISSEAASKIEIYPNPAENILNVKIGTYENRNASIVDLSGRVLITKQLTSWNNTLDLSTIAPSVYLLILKDGNNVVDQQKFIKQ